MNVPLSALYLITDRHQTKGRTIQYVISEALAGGVKFIQLREKDLCAKDFFLLAREVKKMTDAYGAQLLINERVDIAMAVKAYGVHLPADSFKPDEARAMLGQEAILGVSTHSLAEAVAAEKTGADFITFSPVYYTVSKAAYGDPQGIDRLKKICRTVDIPVYALGGINTNNVSEVINAGAFGISMISAIISADDIKKKVEQLLDETKNQV